MRRFENSKRVHYADSDAGTPSKADGNHSAPETSTLCVSPPFERSRQPRGRTAAERINRRADERRPATPGKARRFRFPIGPSTETERLTSIRIHRPNGALSIGKRREHAPV